MNKIILFLIPFLFTVVPGPVLGQVSEPRVYHFNLADVPAAHPFEGITSQRVFSDTVYMPFITIAKGASSRHHNHPDDQTMIILSGRVNALVGDDEYILEKEDILIIPSYVPHRVEALEDSRWIEVHGPGYMQREFDPDSWK